MPKSQNLFQRLTNLFRSGPVIKRKVRQPKGPKSASSALEVFRKSSSDIYNSTLSAYGTFDRMSRYSDFSEMVAEPIIHQALRIYSEETASPDDKGVILHIHSENEQIKELLTELFYGTLNIDFELSRWTYNLCKYGDFFLMLDVDTHHGVVGFYTIRISEIEREEGFDPNKPNAVRFRWLAQNQILQDWQVAHFRLVFDDAFLPYGTSVLESARRVWRQLVIAEDAMLLYRVVRSPERRVFYIDVGATPVNEVPNILEQAESAFRKAPVVNRENGQMDLRFNPLSVLDDYFIPVRGGESGTRIETLQGGTNATAIEDVEYLQKKLFAALGVPKAYIGYDEEIGSKATLAQEDIRFSRAINKIQKVIIQELNKIAMIHLFAHGYDGDDLVNFELQLSNPSSIAVQQRLELISTKFDIAGKAPEGMVNRNWIRKNIFAMTDKDISLIEAGLVEDKITDLRLEATKLPEVEQTPATGEAAGEEEGGGMEALFAADTPRLTNLLNSNETDINININVDSDEEEGEIEIDDDKELIKPSQKTNAFGEPMPRRSRKTKGPAYTQMPDFGSITGVGSTTRGQDSMKKTIWKQSI